MEKTPKDVSWDTCQTYIVNPWLFGQSGQQGKKIFNLKQCKNEGLDNKKAIAFKYMRVCHYLGSPEITGLEDQSIFLKIDI